jgi:AcrR family transcriptional regulator
MHAAPDVPVGKKRLSREDWIAGAWSLLEEEGVAAVRVEVLARRLGVTKGSFYWHFRDRPDLLNALLQAWESAEAQGLAAWLQGGGKPKRLLRGLLDWLRPRMRREVALRLWARSDAVAARALAIIDSQRLALLEKSFAGAGQGKKDAAARALLAYSQLIAQPLLPSDDAADERALKLLVKGK